LKTIWTEKRSSKIGVILQQLRSQGLLNNLFMVEARVSDKNDVHMMLIQWLLPTQVGALKRWMLNKNNHSKRRTHEL
jgi:hypothetical protein